MGIMPDIIIARCDEPLENGIRQKIALFCDVEPECVIENQTLGSLYDVPLMLHEAGLDGIVCRRLGFDVPEPSLEDWRALCGRIANAERSVSVAIVGKYTQLHDAYLSVAEALRHGGYEHGIKVNLNWIESEELEDREPAEVLDGMDAILIPGGFGERGIDGMIAAARYAREKGVPYFGICLGMQIAVIEFARDCAGLTEAHSREFAPASEQAVIDLMPDQRGNLPKGGTMRLGGYPCELQEGTRLREIYGQESIVERHRHRYEVSNAYRDRLAAAGLRFSGMSPDHRLVEAIELPDHPFFVGVQYHPEFKSRPNRAHPIFRSFIEAAWERKK